MRFRDRLYRIIFEADTPEGKVFDVALILAIAASVTVVMLDSVAEIRARHHDLLLDLEWAFTILFTLEYIARIYCARNRIRYVRSFFGIIDLLAILPTYVALLFPGALYITVVRVFRVLRIFRILKIAQYVSESEVLLRAMYASRRKILVFVFFIMTVIVVFGSLMYIIEGAESGFTSIPRSIYWAIVTLTTVGYGDIAPRTPIGQAIAAATMIVGYSIIAVPTGIVTVEISRASRARDGARCPGCRSTSHEPDAIFCKYCGERLEGVERAEFG